MKIKVVTEDGEIKTIDLSAVEFLRQGNQLNTICSANGDFYFTKSGYYDGWGQCAVECETCRTEMIGRRNSN